MKLTAALDALKELSPEDLLKQRVARMQVALVQQFKEQLELSLKDIKDFEIIESVSFSVDIKNLMPEKNPAMEIHLTEAFEEPVEETIAGPLNHQDIVNVMQYMVTKKIILRKEWVTRLG